MSTVWGITDGSAGMRAQVEALAQAMGVSVEHKTVRFERLLSWVPNSVWASPLGGLLPLAFAPTSDPLPPPYPELVISCGRKGAGVALWLRRRARGSTFVCIGDPYVSPKHFDAVVAMAHDTINGANVIKTRFALHRITPELLARAKETFNPPVPAPFITFLIGGSTNKYRVTDEALSALVSQIDALLNKHSGGALITVSRRTGESGVAKLREEFASRPRVFFYDGTGENPYHAFLAHAEKIYVTNDSVNMMTEAAATGKSITILHWLCHEHTKPARFAAEMGAYEDEMGKVATSVRCLLNANNSRS